MTAPSGGALAADGFGARPVWSDGLASDRVQSRWGPVIRARTGRAVVASLRCRAAGGLLPAILLYLLTNRLVEGILYISPDADSPLGDVVGHLGAPGRSAVVGRPSDMAVLRAYAAYDAAVNEKIPYLISFMDGGVSSWFADLVYAEISSVISQGSERSLIVTRTERGEDIVRRAWDAGYLELTDIDVGRVEIDPMRPTAQLRAVSADIG